MTKEERLRMPVPLVVARLAKPGRSNLRDCHGPTASGLAMAKQEGLAMTERRVSGSNDDCVSTQESSQPRYLKILTVVEVIVASGAGYTRS
jgi:hypothetical protein